MRFLPAIFYILLLSPVAFGFGLESSNIHTNDSPKVQPTIPPPPLSPFGSYPNPLHLTDEDRKSFHPLVIFPNIQTDWGETIPNIQILDFTKPWSSPALATPQQRLLAAQGALLPIRPTQQQSSFAIGRYDEDRVGMYESDLFANTDHTIDGYTGRRTVHVGIDVSGPVDTPVHAVMEGRAHAVGYNPDLGDYGHVIVIQHYLTSNRTIYALYGHLDGATTANWKVGDVIGTGQIVGRMGDIHENGGWMIPHVHFQVSLHPPTTHDMPGAVSVAQRPQALVEYWDPRYILGALY